MSVLQKRKLYPDTTETSTRQSSYESVSSVGNESVSVDSFAKYSNKPTNMKLTTDAITINDCAGVKHDYLQLQHEQAIINAVAPKT